MTGVGTRLAAVDSTTVCDGPAQHTVRIITDGQVCYAYGLGTDAADCGPAARLTGTTTEAVIEVRCCQPASHREECDGYARADLTAPNAWTSDTEALALLEQYGEAVDR